MDLTNLETFIDRYKGPTLSFLGAGIGACVLQIIGVHTAIHEVAGHIFLGGYLLHHYAPGKEPRFQVDGWDNFKAIGEADSIQGRVTAIGHWITGYDYNHDNAAGKAWVHGGTPNSLGEAMGPDGLSAFISLSGSLPDLTLSSTAAIGGVQLFERSPKLAAALLGYAIFNHLFSSCYPIDAALMSAEKLTAAAKTGHDFANFALKMSAVTGYAPTTIARATAAIWVSSLPLLIAYNVLSKYAHPKYSVSDEQAELHLQKQGKDEPHSLHEIDEAKGVIHREWRQNRGSPRIYKALKFLSLGRFAIGLSAKWGEALSTSALPALASYVKALKLLTPTLGMVAIGAKLTRVYVDYKADEKYVTKRAKMISVLDAVLTIGISFGLFRGLYGHKSKTFAFSFLAGSLKPIVVGHLRLREDRIALRKAGQEILV